MSRELMQQALEKLEFFAHMKSVSEGTRRLITALRQALETEQEPVAWLDPEENMNTAQKSSGMTDLHPSAGKPS